MVFLIILDDSTEAFVFGQGWDINTNDTWFNGTGHVPPEQSSGQVSLTFNGTSAALFGITPSANDSQTFSVSIDGSEPTKTSYNDPNPPSYRQWYQSPTLAEGIHNISLSLNGASLDFAIVAVGNDTPLVGQEAIVDSENPAITFQGSWKQNKASFISQIIDGLPFQNTTQDTTTVGDSLIFPFTGESAAIFGVFNWSTLGLITLSFTLDGSTLVKSYEVTLTTPQYQSQLGQQPNFEFLSYDFLTPGNHTLVVNLTECVNETVFSFNYITFEPSFSTLTTMPNLTGIGAGNSHSTHGLPVGAIVGIIIAVIAIVSGLSFAAWKKRRSKNNLGVNPFLHTPTTASFPLNTRVTSSTSALSNNTTRIVSNNYTAVRVADPDIPQTGLADTDGEHHDTGGEILPSYDESNRLHPVVVR